MKIDNKLILEYSKNLNILYVEDDEPLRLSTTDIFKNYFALVDTAKDGEDGLFKYNEYLKNHGECYDLVISDINMPIMNGIELASIILSDHYEQSIVFITAHNEIEYLQKSIDLGINGFITKPIRMEQLKKVLYKLTQAIYDRKTVALHYEIMEKFNVELESKNEELEKSLRVLNTMVEKERISIKEKSLSDEDISVSISNQIKSFVNDDLEDTKELHQEIDTDVILVINSSSINIQNYVKNISDGFSKYATILSFYTFFHDLSVSMKEFSVVLRDSPTPENEEDIHNIFALLESFMFVLKKWSEDLESRSNDKLHFLDASLISDMKTIISMWKIST